MKWVRSQKSMVEDLEEIDPAEGSLMEALNKASEEESAGQGDDFSGDDPLYEEAKRIVIENKKASASFLQRKLRIGYPRAARLLDFLTQNGVIGPSNGSKPREVFVSSNTYMGNNEDSNSSDSDNDYNEEDKNDKDDESEDEEKKDDEWEQL